MSQGRQHQRYVKSRISIQSRILKTKQLQSSSEVKSSPAPFLPVTPSSSKPANASGEDEVDVQLAKIDGTIKRNRDPKLLVIFTLLLSSDSNKFSLKQVSTQFKWLLRPLFTN